MKATGIVRRIDDLGRVVIPKEIRRTMRIREGDPLEIYTDRDGEVIFKKYSPVGEILTQADGYCTALNKSSGLAVAICDRDGVLACAGIPKKAMAEQRLPESVEQILAKRGLYTFRMNETKIPMGPEGWHISSLMPILCNGDMIGGVIALSREIKEPGEAEIALVKTAALYLGQGLEE